MPLPIAILGLPLIKNRISYATRSGRQNSEFLCDKLLDVDRFTKLEDCSMNTVNLINVVFEILPILIKKIHIVFE